MKMPLLLIDDGDISVFSSPHSLEKYVESPDISRYLIFDATGARLGLRSSAPDRTGIIVDVKPAHLVTADTEPEPQFLMREIDIFLEKLNVHTQGRAGLAHLIDALVETVGYTQ